MQGFSRLRNFLKIFSNKAFLIVFLFSLAGVLSLFSSNINKSNPEINNVSLSREDTQTESQVLGERTPQIYVSGGREGYSGGGMIALASTDDPSVYIGGYNVAGPAEVLVYQANEEALLDYLTHDKEGKQTKKNPDVNKFRYIAKLDTELASGNGSGSKLLLPIGETGIFFLRIKYNGVSEDSYVVRSNIGALVKEGDNEYIFWGQDFKTRRSVTEGSIKLYNLQDGARELQSVSFNSEGIAKANLDSTADIALVQRNDDRAVIPINLHYLNSSYDYDTFQAKERQTKYFTFTDRPLYRPGDTVYFKSILRDDDDARYTIPTGQASVKIYEGWEEESVIFSQNYPISTLGTIDGKYVLPADSKIGYYRLVISIQGTNSSTASFDVQFFRKPEHFIDITAENTEIVSGDKAGFKINGSYFSGQPLGHQIVKYKVYSGDFYEYGYLTERSFALSDEYRYGYWGGEVLTDGETNLNQAGEASIDLNTKLSGKGRNQVFSIEAEFDNGSGDPSFARKNILVFAGEYDIYRKDYSFYSTKVGNQASLPIVLVSHRNTNVSGINLTAKVHRENWIPYDDPSSKYPLYKKEEEDLPSINVVTDSQGGANVNFTPLKIGSYTITLEGKDSKNNLISKAFYTYVSSEDESYYLSSENNDITISTDKEKYSPTDKVTFTISSTTPDRDVFLSLERGRVNRFQVVHLKGKSMDVEVPLVTTDIPNIFAKVSSFSSQTYDTNSTKVVVSRDSKNLVVKVSPSAQTFGPSENVTVDVTTTDLGGNPISADVALWTVDKALFALVDERPEKIIDTFWEERYNNTQEAHSLEGIIVLQAERGGCFDGDTKVLMANGEKKSINQIKVGEEVLTRESERSSKLSRAKVKSIHQAKVAGYFVINGHLKVTSNHRLWVNGAWKEASSLQTGDLLTDQDGKDVYVSSIEWLKGDFEVYNLEIEKFATYFAGGVWVHNQKGGGSRTIFKDTAYWNPSLQTDASGKAKVTFKLPDNLTTWVIAAVGATKDTKVGQTTSEILVTKDIIVRPILPNILRVGDEIVLSALVQNFSQTDHNFDINLKFDAVDIKSTPQISLPIKSKETKQVYWTVYAKQESDKAKMTFSAISKEDEKISDTIEQEIPIRPFGFKDQTAKTGDGDETFAVKLSSDVHKEKSNITLSLSPTYIGTLPKAMEYLIEYPYGCVEQTTSRFVPALIAKQNKELFATSLEGKDIDGIIQKGLSRLSSLQHADGGWSWWSTGQSDPFVTSYVVEYLVYAQQAGVKVESSLISNAKYYLSRTSNYDAGLNAELPFTPEVQIIQNYGLSLLGEKGQVMPAGILDSLPADILSLAVITNYLNGDKNPQTNGLDRLQFLAKPQGESVFWEPGSKINFASQDASTALAIKAIVLAGGDRELAVKGARFLSRNRQSNYWSNTFATAQVIRALVELSKTGEELTPNYTYTVSLDNNQIAKGSVTSAKQVVKDIVIPVADIKSGGSNIAITKNGDGQIYSTLVINQFHTSRNASAFGHGLNIKREYINNKGEEYTLAVGDTVTVNLTVSGLKSDENYAVLADELPSGLIPINQTFKNQQYGQPATPNYLYEISDREVTENGMLLSLYQIASGSKTYTYQARVVSEGSFTVPPASASLMYAPEIYGRSEVQTLKVTKESQIIPGKAFKKALTKYFTKENIRGLIILAFILAAIAMLLRKQGITLSTVKENIRKILKRNKNSSGQ